MPVNPRRIRSTAQLLLRAEKCDDNAEVSILLTNDENIAILNRTYRETDGPTDVLAFSQLEGEEGFAEDEAESPLGDVVISVETAQRQAAEHGHNLDEEIDVLLVHGILHLLGYDHAEPEDERAMFARQAELLKGMSKE